MFKWDTANISSANTNHLLNNWFGFFIFKCPLQMKVVLKIDLICIASNAVYVKHASTTSIQTKIPFLDILPCK